MGLDGMGTTREATAKCMYTIEECNYGVIGKGLRIHEADSR